MTDESSKPITYAFVDAANVIYRGNGPNDWKIDLRKLLGYLKERFGASAVFYYGGIDRKNDAQCGINRKMAKWGYLLRLNPVKYFQNEQGKLYRKADVDSRMTFEIMQKLPQYDRAIVLTGDGDFYWVLEYLLQQKDRVWLVANPRKTAKELKKLFGANFANLDSLRSQLEYKKDEADSTNDSASGMTLLV